MQQTISKTIPNKNARGFRPRQLVPTVIQKAQPVAV